MTRSRSNILPLLCGTDEKLKQTGSVVVLDVLLLTFSVQMSAAYTSLMKYLKQTSCERSVRNYNVSICKQWSKLHHSCAMRMTCPDLSKCGAQKGNMETRITGFFRKEIFG